MNQFTLLIIDDNEEWCSSLERRLADCSFLSILPSIHNGESALRYINSYRPDILILDLILPDYDGMYIISYIRKHMQDYKPFIYVLSAIVTSKTNRVLRDLDIDYYSVKPINEKAVANNIQKFLNVHDTIQNAETDDSNGEIDAFGSSIPANVDLMIDDFLYELGAKLSLLATDCARVAIKCCIFDRTNTNMSMVYKKVAEQFSHSISPSAIERNIRSTVTQIKKKDSKYFKQCFGSVDKLNNSQFVYLSAHILRHSMEENLNGPIFSRKDSGFYHTKG